MIAGSGGGPDSIAGIVLLEGANSQNSTFGELLPSSLSGFVYYDINNDGVKQGTEAVIPGTVETLTGSNDLGTITLVAATTDATGKYIFGNLRTHTYTITESQPARYLDGKDNESGDILSWM